jgi:hypothetical protein
MSQDEDELWQVLQSVHDEESFRQFLLALRDDRERSVAQEKEAPSSPLGPEAGGWENTTIERFFEHAAAWAKESVNGTGGYTKPDNPWQRCADILYAGKIYE